jgi:hypothetical protein
MSSKEQVDVFSALALVISVIGLILMVFFEFAGFFLPGYGYRYSCWDCEYSTLLDFLAQIIIMILFVALIVIALNELVPEKFITGDLTKTGLAIAALIVIFNIVGLVAFGIEYFDYEWWPETGFYGGFIAGK